MLTCHFAHVLTWKFRRLLHDVVVVITVATAETMKNGKLMSELYTYVATSLELYASKIELMIIPPPRETHPCRNHRHAFYVCVNVR